MTRWMLLSVLMVGCTETPEEVTQEDSGKSKGAEVR